MYYNQVSVGHISLWAFFTPHERIIIYITCTHSKFHGVLRMHVLIISRNTLPIIVRWVIYQIWTTPASLHERIHTHRLSCPDPFNVRKLAEQRKLTLLGDTEVDQHSLLSSKSEILLRDIYLMRWSRLVQETLSYSHSQHQVLMNYAGGW